MGYQCMEMSYSSKTYTLACQIYLCVRLIVVITGYWDIGDTIPLVAHLMTRTFESTCNFAPTKLVTILAPSKKKGKTKAHW